MTIPDFQTIMLPLLELAGDGKEHTVAEARAALGDRFGLSEQERAELLPSGKQARFGNRVGWAKTYLERAGLLVKPRRGVFRLTDAGKKVLEASPPKIDLGYLKQFPELEAFRKGTAKTTEAEEPEAASTPEEALDAAYDKIRDDLAAELLDQVRSASPTFFERLVVDLMLKMGYGGFREGAGFVTPASGDAGIDGVINEDRLGLDVVYLQAKRWEGSVGRPEIQKFVGALHGKRARKGVFITTSSFSGDARDYVEHIDPRVVLIDGTELARLMIDYDIGVSTSQTYRIKRIDTDYFEDE